MAFSGIVIKPRVVVQGGAVVKDNTYTVNGAAADWKAGDLLRLNNNGTVQLVADARRHLAQGRVSHRHHGQQQDLRPYHGCDGGKPGRREHWHRG